MMPCVWYLIAKLPLSANLKVQCCNRNSTCVHDSVFSQFSKVFDKVKAIRQYNSLTFTYPVKKPLVQCAGRGVWFNLKKSTINQSIGSSMNSGYQILVSCAGVRSGKKVLWKISIFRSQSGSHTITNELWAQRSHYTSKCTLK